MTTKHLDLGCGPCPRNPYSAEEVYGVDISPSPELSKDHFVRANLALETIPFPSNTFDSASAFDFIEHIPRQIHSLESNTSRLPFVELMNEIWRVLKPNGVFYALTPAYPNTSAFQDPTHVNIITESTHTYFCGDEPLGSMYGFTGKFKVKRAEWVVAKDSFDMDSSITKSIRYWHRRLFKPSGLSHLVWEFEAIKP
jgi:SAM-dependent methyltransferase